MYVLYDDPEMVIDSVSHTVFGLGSIFYRLRGDNCNTNFRPLPFAAFVAIKTDGYRHSVQKRTARTRQKLKRLAQSYILASSALLHTP